MTGAESKAGVVRIGADAASSDPLLGTLLALFPDARVLSRRERIVHERPIDRDLSRAPWRQLLWYGRPNFVPFAFRFRGDRLSRGTDRHAVRRRAAGKREKHPRPPHEIP